MVKAINAEVNLNFIFVARAQTSTSQCLRDYSFLPHSYVFVLKLKSQWACWNFCMYIINYM